MDGCPDTKYQAQDLTAAGVEPRFVFLCHRSKEEMLEAAVHNRYDPVSRRTFHLQKNPPTDPVVLKRLVQKPNETRQAIEAKWEACQYEFSRLRAYYGPKVVYDVDATSLSPADALLNGLHLSLHIIDVHVHGLQQRQLLSSDRREMRQPPSLAGGMACSQGGCFLL